MKTEKTITGDVDPDVLDYTVGDDPVLDMDLVTWVKEKKYGNVHFSFFSPLQAES